MDVLRALLEAFLTGAETVIACLPDDSLVHALPKGQDRMRFTKESFETTKAIDIPQKHSRPDHKTCMLCLTATRLSFPPQ